MIRAVIFDLGNVLVPFDTRRGYEALAAVNGLPPEEVKRRIAATGLVPPFERGEVSPEEFVRRLSAALHLEVSYERFCELWSSIFLPETLVPESLVEGLKRRSRLLVLSNTNAIHFAMIQQRYPILRHFDDHVLSYEMGYLKPAPEIYRAAIARAGCAPEEIFFTDDLEANVEAARREGIDAVRFESAEQLKRELERRGLA
ncbi:MAG: HAD family phosphatase [Bryobacterales bacterium]|nr:HAD family phosphatase [Bryobacteraceae bacterium]MDW8353948.1 HAD family phosphatase [Bryobacterales bacterium]